MKPIRKKRLYIVLFVMAFSALGIALLVFAMKDNMNLFFAPAAIAAGKAPLDKQIRIGGYVVKGSLQRQPDGLTLNFRLTDGVAEVTVSYTGILPDLFSEGEAAVVKGKLLSENNFLATEVLAKHDENYTPPEVQQSAVKPQNNRPQ
jgi:cytochrome c-type biogenesis protein CcmE